jgi:hypothetical protein
VKTIVVGGLVGILSTHELTLGCGYRHRLHSNVDIVQETPVELVSEECVSENRAGNFI